MLAVAAFAVPVAFNFALLMNDKARRGITPAAPIISSIAVNVPAKGHQPVPHAPKSRPAQAPERARRFHIPASDAPGALDVYDGRELLGTVLLDDHEFESSDAALAAIPDKGRRA
jgi:hypothetical protein